MGKASHEKNLPAWKQISILILQNNTKDISLVFANGTFLAAEIDNSDAIDNKI